jgi:hypothetical protein
VIASLRHSLNLQNQASIVMVLACGFTNALMAVLNGFSVLTDMASAVRWGWWLSSCKLKASTWAGRDGKITACCWH